MPFIIVFKWNYYTSAAPIFQRFKIYSTKLDFTLRRAIYYINKDTLNNSEVFMKTAIAEEAANAAVKESCRKTIDLGNGVMFPVDSEDEAGFVEWMVQEARAGRASLPKRAPRPAERPPWLDASPKMSSEEFWAFYKDERADRI